MESSNQDQLPNDIGPELPPEFGQTEVQGKFTDDKEKSFLKDSIKKKGTNSYYYAHDYSGQNFDDKTAAKVYGDGIIHGGDPVLVQTKSKKEEEKSQDTVTKPDVMKIQKYSWSDEESKVKIYIFLD